LAKLFGKRPTEPENKGFFPENRLEALLIQASTDSNTRADFYREFLNGEIFVLGETPSATIGAANKLDAGEKVLIREVNFDGRNVIPVFSSLRRLQESISENTNYLRLNGKSFIELVGFEKEIILNPGLAYGKQFLPGEIKNMLDGSVFHPQVQEMVIQKEQKAIIGEPAEYPEELIKRVRSLLQGRPEIRRAYLAWFSMDPSEKPHYLIAIDLTGDIKSVFDDIGKVVTDTLDPGKSVSMIQLRGSSGLENYFKDKKPFFERE